MDKFNLVVRAARELVRAIQENYYDLSDLNIINYSNFCSNYRSDRPGKYANIC